MKIKDVGGTYPLISPRITNATGIDAPHAGSSFTGIFDREEVASLE